MYEVQKLKDVVYRQLEESGAYRSMTSQLKSQVLTIVEAQSEQTKNKLGFSYQHPLLPKLLKYEHSSQWGKSAALCLDLIQEFLESFKFEYTLSVFMKEVHKSIKQINRTQKANRQELTAKLGLKEKAHQPALISLVSADERTVKQGGGSAKESAKGAAAASSAPQKDHPPQEPPKKAEPKKEQPKEEPAPPKKKIQTIPSTAPPEVKADKEQKKTAQDFLRGILSKAPPQPENKPQERAVSAPPTILKKEPPPPESGVNKIRGGVSNKPSPLSALLGLGVTAGSNPSAGGAKDPYAYDLKKGGSPFGKKKQEDIEQDIDEFQNSQNSSYSRRNPLFSSTENSGMYDQSVNSVEIEDYDYYQSVRKRKK